MHGNIIAPLRFRIGKGDLLIQLVVVVRHAGYELLELKQCLAPEAFHEQHVHLVRQISSLVFLVVFHQRVINDPLHVILIGGPCLLFLIPDGIEAIAADHQIAGSYRNEIRVNIHRSASGRLLFYLKKIHGRNAPIFLPMLHL